jgi:hypothetical protein
MERIMIDHLIEGASIEQNMPIEKSRAYQIKLN